MNPMQLDRQCLLSGCQISRAGHLAAEATTMLDQAVREKRETMAAQSHASLWCDLGEHSFSARDRKRTVYKVETIDEETGQPMEDELMACGPHAAERRPMLAPRSQLPAGPPKGADAELYTEFLEWKAGQRTEAPAP